VSTLVDAPPAVALPDSWPLGPVRMSTEVWAVAAPARAAEASARIVYLRIGLLLSQRGGSGGGRAEPPPLDPRQSR
jgi:hypothetical protein